MYYLKKLILPVLTILGILVFFNTFIYSRFVFLEQENSNNFVLTMFTQNGRTLYFASDKKLYDYLSNISSTTKILNTNKFWNPGVCAGMDIALTNKNIYFLDHIFDGDKKETTSTIYKYSIENKTLSSNSYKYLIEKMYINPENRVNILVRKINNLILSYTLLDDRNIFFIKNLHLTESNTYINESEGLIKSCSLYDNKCSTLNKVKIGKNLNGIVYEKDIDEYYRQTHAYIIDNNYKLVIPGEYTHFFIGSF